jgi:uncharacterized protein
MVQVSYPGVYIREVSSGARTITGVATSIAAIIGMASRGPVGEPRRVLGFVDFERIFGADTTQGELTDQVRQFFQNGGQQAFIVRVAKDSTPSVAVLETPDGTPVLTLTATSDGSDSAQLRASVDYKTANPERTFNLRLFREIVDGNGNATLGEDELHKDVSMDPADPRYVVTVLEQNSAIANAADTASAIVAIDGYSASAVLGNDAALVTAVNAAIGVPGTGRFRIKVGSRPFVTATITLGAALTTGTIGAAFDTAIRTAYSLGADVTATTVTAGFLRIEAAGTEAGRDVVIERATSDDIAAELGLGVAQGGLEVGALSVRRPKPSGYVSVLGADLAAVLALGALLRENLTSLTLTGAEGWLVLAPSFRFSPTTGALNLGSAAGASLRNIRENLLVLAAGINASQNRWRAEVQGHRLALVATFGTAASGTGHVLTGQGTGWATLGGTFDDPAATTADVVAAGFGGGSDGTPPELPEYEAAFNALDTNVDLFNLMLLPRSFDDTVPDRRVEIWGPASAFCQRRRAFLLVDAIRSADTVDDILSEVNNLRIGLVKDHAALYWPPLRIPAGGNLTRDIDPSGSIAGLMSRIDSTRGVWKAPAGLEADVRGIRGVAVPMSDPENGLLNPQAINAIRLFPNGIVSWGARTMDGFDNSGNDDFKYVPVRRFTLFIEESLFRGLKFAVFEPNDEPLWAQIRLAAGAFMNNLFRQGAFAGKTTTDAYFVKVDRETTTQNDINLGIVNVLVGFAPLKPAEFVIVTIQQKAGQVQV